VRVRDTDVPHSGQNFARPTGDPQSRQLTTRCSRSAADTVALAYAASRARYSLASRWMAASSASSRGTQVTHTPSSAFQQSSHMFCEQRGHLWKCDVACATAERSAPSLARE
jgi:hypothetical protein